MPVIQQKCGPAEKADLIRMLDKVAAADGTVGEAEQLALARMKRELTR